MKTPAIKEGAVCRGELSNSNRKERHERDDSNDSSETNTTKKQANGI